jgi:hypothetical protein
VVKKTLYIFLFFLVAAFAAGCNPGIVEPPPASIGDAKDYMWSDSISKMDYEIYDQIAKTKTGIQLMLSRQSDFVYVSQYPVLNSNPFYYTTTSGAITLHNLTTSTFFSLPDGYEVAAEKLDTIRQVSQMGIKKVLTVSNAAVLAVADDSALYISSDNGAHWIKDPLWKSEYGIVVCWTLVQASGLEMVYAGTSSGMVLSSSDHGYTWKIVINKSSSGPVTAIAASKSGDMYYVSTNAPATVMHQFPSGTSDKLIAQGKYITAIAVVEPSDSVGATDSMLIILVGLQDKGIYYWYKDRNSISYAVNSFQDTLLGVYDFSIAGSTCFAVGARMGGGSSIMSSTDRGANWYKVKSNYTDMRFVDVPGSYDWERGFSASEIGSFYSFGKNDVTLSQKTKLQFGVVRGISAFANTIFAATDSGAAISSDAGATWKLLSGGLPQIIHTSVVKNAGGIVLLPYLADGIKVGTTWDAGSLHKKDSPDSLLVHFKATVITHDDSLSLPNAAGVYKDVFEVEYAPESVGGTVIGSIKVFFTKYDGPILVQSYLGTTLLKQVYRIKK